MSSISILCPKCKQQISIDEALAPQLQEQIKVQVELEREADRRKMLAWQEEKEKKLTESLTEELKKQLVYDSEKELKLMKEQMAAKDEELSKARELELQIRKERNLLEEDKKSFELKLQRQLDEEKDKIRQQTTQTLLEEHRLKDAEKDKKVSDMLRQIEELKQKAEQGSQQTQGEVQELELEQTLKTEFPVDEILPVPKGVNGADVMQRVHDLSGRDCGVILWESKRTKNWSEEWVSKLKDDLRASKADVAILVTTALPDGIKNFGPKDGIYVTSYDCFLSLAKMLRITLNQLCLSKLSSVGKNEKMEIIWNYLSGNEFKHKVEAIVEAFSSMKQDLDRERVVYMKFWAKREKQIQRVIENTIGMHGDLQGLMGASLPEIESLQIDTVETLEQVDDVRSYTRETTVHANVIQPNLEELLN